MEDQNLYSYQFVDEQKTQDRATAEAAGRGQRLLAAIIDGVIVSAVSTLVTYAVTGEFLLKPEQTDGNPLMAALLSGSSPRAIVITLTAVLISLAIQARFIAKRSQTIGKLALGIVVNKHASMERAGFARIAVKRMLLIDVLSTIPIVGSIFGLVDILFIFRKDRRCIHDLIAGTWVVKR